MEIDKINCKKCKDKMLKVESAGFEFYECSNKDCDNSFTLYNIEPIDTESVNFA